MDSFEHSDYDFTRLPKKWKYTLPSSYGASLMNAIDEENISAIVSAMKAIIRWMKGMRIPCDDLEDEVSYIDPEDSDLDEVNYCLDLFYDICDEYRVWANMI